MLSDITVVGQLGVYEINYLTISQPICNITRFCVTSHLNCVDVTYFAVSSLPHVLNLQINFDVLYFMRICFLIHSLGII